MIPAAGSERERPGAAHSEGVEEVDWGCLRMLICLLLVVAIFGALFMLGFLLYCYYYDCCA